MLKKCTQPTNLSMAPYKTLWKYENDEGVYEIYIQLSETNHMEWKRLGFLFEEAFEKFITEDESFIDDALRLMKNKNQESSYT